MCAQVDDALKLVREQLEAERKMAAEMRQAMEDQELEMEILRKRVNRDMSINNGLQEPAKSPSGSKHDLTVARDEIKGLKHIVQEMQQEILAANQQNKALTSENELLSSEIEKLRAELNTLENNFEQSLLREEQTLDDGSGGADDASAQKARQELKAKYEMELEQLRKRHAEAEMKSARTIHDLNKEVSELETLVESKIYREDELEREVERLKEKVTRGQKKTSKNSTDADDARMPVPPGRSSISSNNALQLDHGELVCEICERPGHDIFSCDLLSDDTASLRSNKSGKPAGADLYCEDCEGHGHTAAECPHSLDVF
ncbi:hypothetical protein NEOLEDRAFT_682934 [Neolentinus lepideus HHB14362 ss-1]|uniref:CLIP1 zinc knuckle domain-containing protein n=1 Tax=Neolentinus lepideus HHB14362 ss-1 TaxID=1314782 RepID=A0A165UZC7_9AGAM|nr:hypothetical protein NEOLEDRAFT_682934 [Neolentinus lepideus HHB14362 ss-1]